MHCCNKPNQSLTIQVSKKYDSVFSLAVKNNKLSEEVAYWNGRGYTIIQGYPFCEGIMYIVLKKVGFP